MVTWFTVFFFSLISFAAGLAIPIMWMIVNDGVATNIKRMQQEHIAYMEKRWPTPEKQGD